MSSNEVELYQALYNNMNIGPIDQTQLVFKNLNLMDFMRCNDKTLRLIIGLEKLHYFSQMYHHSLTKVR